MRRLTTTMYCNFCNKELKTRGQDNHIGMIVRAIGYSYLDGNEDMCYQGQDYRDSDDLELDFCNTVCLSNYINELKAR